MNELNKKSKKYLNESIQYFKKNLFNPMIDKDKQHFIDYFKDNLCYIINFMLKDFNELSFNTENKEIKDDNQLILPELKNLFYNYTNEYITEEQFNQFISKFISSTNIGEQGESFKTRSKTTNDIIVPIQFISNIFNKEDNLTLKDFKLNSLFKEEELNELNKTKKTKVSDYNFNIANIILKEGEILGDSFNCFYFDYIIIQGKLTITNLRIIFQKIDNSTIEILKTEIVSKNKKIDNIFNKLLIIKTINSEYVFSGLLNIDNCLLHINELFNKNIENDYVDEFEEDFVNSINNCNISPPKKVKNNIDIELNKPNIINLIPDSSSIDSILNKLKEINQSNLSSLTNTIKQSYSHCFLKLNKLDNIPIFLIYKYLYCPNTICKEYNYNKNFINSLLELRKDYEISFTQTESQNIPKYYSSPLEYTVPLLCNLNKEELEIFLNESNTAYPSITSYEYKYTHTVVKKQFMGPSKLNMQDIYKIILVSPLCLIVEITSHISGFMMMDTFYTVAQYKYDMTMSFVNNKIVYNTTLNGSFDFVFVKECWFKNKIETNGLIENEEYMKDFILVNIKKVLASRNTVFINECNKRKKSDDVNINHSELMEESLYLNDKGYYVKKPLDINPISRNENHFYFDKKSSKDNQFNMSVNSFSIMRNISNGNKTQFYLFGIIQDYLKKDDIKEFLIIMGILILLSLILKLFFGDFAKEILLYGLLGMCLILIVKSLKKSEDVILKLEDIKNI